MPQVIPFIVGTAAAAGAGTSIYQGQKQVSESKKAASAASEQNAVAIKNVQAAQVEASTKAVESVRRRTSQMTQTNFTSPIGISTQAATSRKVLLGE